MFYKLLNAYTRQFAFPHRGLKYFLKAARWLGLADKTYNKKLANNIYMQVNPSEHIQQQLFWYGYYEKELGDLIRKILRPGDVFIDVGANIGYFSLLAAKHQPTAKIFSFEPVSPIFKQFEENISINEFKNITAINAAIGEKNEEREIYISGDDNKGMSSFEKPENYSGKTETVRVIELDNWLRTSGFARVDLIKIDVEGSEFFTLKGMKETLRDFKPLIIVEINPQTLLQFNSTSKDIFNYLNDLGFDNYLVLKNGKLERINTYQFEETNNVLFVHNESINTSEFKELLTTS
jgi:FkbM family methyltransferase